MRKNVLGCFLSACLAGLSVATSAQAQKVVIPYSNLQTKVLNQYSLGTCASQALSVMLDSKINLTAQNGNVWQSNPEYLAANYHRFGLTGEEQLRVSQSILNDLRIGGPSQSYNPNSLRNNFFDAMRPLEGVKQGACAASSATPTQVLGAGICDVYEAFKLNDYRTCRYDYPEIFQKLAGGPASSDDWNRKLLWTWSGMVPSIFEGCRIELNRTVSYMSGVTQIQGDGLTFAEKGSKDPNSPWWMQRHPAFRSTSARCIKLFNSLQQYAVRWWNSSVAGVPVVRGEKLNDMYACAYPSANFNCTPQARNDLIAFVKLVKDAKIGYDPYSQFIEATCYLFEDPANFRDLSCRTFWVRESGKVVIESRPAVRPVAFDDMVKRVKASLVEGRAVGIGMDVNKILRRPLGKTAYHAMAILGFDDEGGTGLGKLLLRNSWGATCNDPDGQARWISSVKCEEWSGDLVVPYSALVNAQSPVLDLVVLEK